MRAKIYDLAGLFIGEIPHRMIAHLAKKGPVALDMQAMLRYSDGDRFGFRDWPEKKEYLPADNLSQGGFAGSRGLHRLRPTGKRQPGSCTIWGPGK